MPRMDEMKRLQDNLMVLMKATGIDNQSKLSRKAGVSQTNLSNIQRGSVSPTLDTLAQLSTALGIETWQLLAPPDVINMTRLYVRLNTQDRETVQRIAESLSQSDPTDCE